MYRSYSVRSEMSNTRWLSSTDQRAKEIGLYKNRDWNLLFTHLIVLHHPVMEYAEKFFLFRLWGMIGMIRQVISGFEIKGYCQLLAIDTSTLVFPIDYKQK